MKLTWLLFVSMLLFAGQCMGQSLSMEMRGLGTKEESTLTVDGIDIIFPLDQDDLVKLLLPALQKYRETRQNNAEQEAAAVAMAYDGFTDQLGEKTRKVLGLPTLSDDFDDSLEMAIANYGIATRKWRLWSEDVREIHFWNHATMAPFQTTENGMSMTEFSDLRFFNKNGGGFSLNFRMPFVALIGTGVERLDLSPQKIERHQLDLPIFSKPGLSATESADEMKKLIQVISDLHQKTLIETVSSEVGLKYVQESLLRDEIDASFFKGNSRSSILIKGLSRIHLYTMFEGNFRENPGAWVLNSFYFQIPEDSGEATAFLEGLKDIDPLGEVEEKHHEAASRIFAFSIFRTLLETGTKGMPFMILKNNGIETPIDGFTDETFLAAWKTVFPDFDERLRKSQEELIELQLSKVRTKTEDDDSDRAGETFVLPDDYLSKKFGDFTISFPQTVAEAVDVLGAKWAKELPKAQKSLRDRYSKSLAEPVNFDASDIAALQALGLKVNKAEAKMWSQQTAALANAASMVANAFGGNKIQIWLKADAMELLKSGQQIPHFKLGDVDGEITFSYEAEVSMDEIEGEWSEAYAKALREKALMLPLVFKDEKLGDKTVEEQVTALREADFLIGSLIEKTDQINPEMLGVTSRWLSKEQSFFYIVHELVEADLVRRYIASSDRRWFCDGLANVVAIRQCDRRFGKGEGMKTFRLLYAQEEMRKHAEQVDLLAWQAAEFKDTVAAKAEGVTAAHYFFATEALLKVMEGRDDQFIIDWLSKIRETKWVRTNAETVIRAFNEISGDGDLRKVVAEISDPADEAEGFVR